MNEHALTTFTVSLHDDQLSRRFESLLSEQGFVIVTDAYTDDELHALRNGVMALEARAEPGHEWCVYQGEFLWAIWNLYELAPALMRLALAPRVFSLMAAYLGEPAEFCRATLMKKAPGNSAAVRWHQDVPVAVDRDLRDADSVGVRDGVPHRNAPPGVLQRMVAARINVEHSYEDGGCLQVIPKSHLWGVLPSDDETSRRVEAEAENILPCPAPAGSVLFYHPLLAHSSAASTREETEFQRRVIHNEFRAASLQPGGGAAWYPWRHAARIEDDGVFFPSK